MRLGLLTTLHANHNIVLANHGPEDNIQLPSLPRHTIGEQARLLHACNCCHHAMDVEHHALKRRRTSRRLRNRFLRLAVRRT